MKAALALLAFAALTSTGYAVEYVTLNVAPEGQPEFGLPDQTLAIPPTSLVQIEGSLAEGVVVLSFVKSDGKRIFASRQSGGATTAPNTEFFAGGITGVTEANLRSAPGRGFVTLKITSATELNAVTPSAVLVLPEESTGNFDIIIESSDDLLKWSPFFSQTVNSQTAHRFFRTRVTKTP